MVLAVLAGALFGGVLGLVAAPAFWAVFALCGALSGGAIAVAWRLFNDG